MAGQRTAADLCAIKRPPRATSYGGQRPVARLAHLTDEELDALEVGLLLALIAQWRR